MADPEQDTYYHAIDNNFGYCCQFQVASALIKKHEENTSTKYSLLRSDPNFGKSTWNNEDCRIQWEEGEKTVGKRLMFDGVPFFVLGTRHLGCQFGSEHDEKMSIYLEWKKDADGNECEAKKEKCPAKIILKEVIKFPHYKIETNSSYERKKWSKVVREDLCKGTAQTERRIYVELPKSEAHVHTITWKKSTSEVLSPIPSHCLVCNAKLSSSARSTVSIFSEGARTSHRQLEVSSVLGDIVNQKLEAPELHSTTICSKCFNLIDDIDSLEEQLSNKKQSMVDKYARTMVEVTGKPDPNVDPIEDYEDRDDLPYGKPRRVRDRKRGRPPGRIRGRGSGRPRGRPRTGSLQKSPDKSIVKVEVDQDKIEGLTVSYITAMASPQSLKTIKKEDIMDRFAFDAEQSAEETTILVTGDAGEAPSVDAADSDDNKSSEMDDEDDCFEVDKVDVDMDDNVETVDHVSQNAIGKSIAIDSDIASNDKDSVTLNIMEELAKDFEGGGSNIQTGDFFRDKENVTLRLLKESPMTCSSEVDIEMEAKEGPVMTDQRERKENKVTRSLWVRKENTFTCKICDEQFGKMSLVRDHIKHLHEEISLSCDICGEKCVTRHLLKKHLTTHPPSERKQCEECEQCFTTTRLLKTHMTRTHRRKIVCKVCGKSLMHKKSLDNHMRLHTGERPFQCSICGVTFTHRSNMATHIQLTHKKVKNYSCDQCEKTFTRRRLLDYHMQSAHTGERPYKCEICDAAFVYPHFIKKHMKSHSGIKPYKCTVCDKSFRTKQNYSYHLFAHTLKKPYECNICHAGFMRKPRVISHIASVHGITEKYEEFVIFLSASDLMPVEIDEVSVVFSDEELSTVLE